MNVRFTETVTRKRFDTGQFGDADGSVEALEIPGCFFAPDTSTEVLDRSEAVVTAMEMYVLDVNADIKHNDEIQRSDGETWAVRGEPSRWRSPFTGWQPGLVVLVSKRRG